jgi:hypothetical protein
MRSIASTPTSVAAPKLDPPPRIDLSKVRVLWAPFRGMQTEFVNAAEFEVFGGGAKGPGKSDCLIAAATRQTNKERYKALLIRETGPQLLELMDRTHRMFPRLANGPAWRGDIRRWTWPSGASSACGAGPGIRARRATPG